MNISEKKRSELYTAIHEPIMQKRIAAKKIYQIQYNNKLDDMLYELEREIWIEVRKALNISGS